MAWFRWGWAGMGIRIWYLISLASELKMSHSWPLFYFKRLLALLSSENDRAVASMDFTEPNLTFPCGPLPLRKTHFSALSLEEPGTSKLISEYAASVFEPLLQLGPLSSPLSFLLCFLTSLEFYPLPLSVPTSMHL